MEAEIALLVTIFVLFLSWLYLTGSRKKENEDLSTSQKGDSRGKNSAIQRSQGDSYMELQKEAAQADGVIERGKDSVADAGGSRTNSTLSAKETRPIIEAFDDADDISDLIIDPRDIKPLPVGMRLPVESSDPDSVKQYVRDLRAHQEDDMTEEELQQEKEVQQQQLAEIFQLMQNSQEKFGIDSIDDIEEQMKLYAKT